MATNGPDNAHLLVRLEAINLPRICCETASKAFCGSFLMVLKSVDTSNEIGHVFLIDLAIGHHMANPPLLNRTPENLIFPDFGNYRKVQLPFLTSRTLRVYQGLPTIPLWCSSWLYRSHVLRGLTDHVTFQMLQSKNQQIIDSTSRHKSRDAMFKVARKCPFFLFSVALQTRFGSLALGSQVEAPRQLRQWVSLQYAGPWPNIGAWLPDLSDTSHEIPQRAVMCVHPSHRSHIWTLRVHLQALDEPLGFLF